MKETRTFRDIEIRAEDETPGVTLQAIKPGIVDDYGSLWKANAFDESLSTRLPTLCWAHDWSEPLGPGVSFVAGRGGPKVSFNFSDFEAVPRARQAYAQVKDGTIGDCSVGFSDTQRRAPTDDERAKHPGIKEVIERANLDEISLVLRGAVPGAKVLSVRSARMADGSELDAEFLIELGKKVAAGELTHEQAQATITLASTPAHTESVVDDQTVVEDFTHEALDAEMQVALATLE